MSADATFWEQVALHGDLSRWTIDDVARAELAAWEEAKGLQLPEDFRDAALDHGGSGFGGAVVVVARQGLLRSGLSVRVEGILDPLARGHALESVDRQHDHVREHLEFVFSEHGNDLRPQGAWYLPIAWNTRKELFCLDYTFSDVAPPVVFFDRNDDWGGNADSFSGLRFVSRSFTDFTELIEFPDTEIAFAEGNVETEPLLEWNRHRDVLFGFSEGVRHEFGGTGHL